MSELDNDRPTVSCPYCGSTDLTAGQVCVSVKGGLSITASCDSCRKEWDITKPQPAEAWHPHRLRFVVNQMMGDEEEIPDTYIIDLNFLVFVAPGTNANAAPVTISDIDVLEALRSSLTVWIKDTEGGRRFGLTHSVDGGISNAIGDLVRNSYFSEIELSMPMRAHGLHYVSVNFDPDDSSETR